MAAHDNVLLSQAVGAVYRTYKRWGIEIDDIKQEALLAWYHPITQMAVDSAAETKTAEQYGKYAYRVLKNAALHYAEKEKAHRSGYSPDDQYRYSAAVVRELLPLMLDPTGPVLLGERPGGGKPAGLASEGGDLPAMVADVRVGFKRLDPDDREFIVSVLQYGYEILAVISDSDADSIRQRYYRVCGRLAASLSEYRDEPQSVGLRRVMTNAEALARTRGSYE